LALAEEMLPAQAAVGVEEPRKAELVAAQLPMDHTPAGFEKPRVPVAVRVWAAKVRVVDTERGKGVVSQEGFWES
jgi:hypothetical protein